MIIHAATFDPDRPVVIGARYRFDYPPVFTTMPDHTAHAGQEVTVVRMCTEDEAEPADHKNGITQLYVVRADDGWEGQAYEEELTDIQTQEPAR